MTAISQLKRRQAKKITETDNGLIESILDLLDQAYVLTSKSGDIEYANSKAVELTGYTRKELSQLSLHTLAPSLGKIADIEDGTDAQLITRRSTPLEIQFQIKNLPHSGGLLAYKISLQSDIAEEASRQRRDEGRWKAIQVLNLAAQQRDKSSAQRQILQAGNLLTGAQHLAIYETNMEGNLALKSVQGSGLEFPAVLDSKEMAALRKPGIWSQGGGTQNDIHRLAHSADLRYLATSPLDLTDVESGILIAADYEKSPAPDLLTLLQVLAASVITTKLQLELLEKMKEDLNSSSNNSKINQLLENKVQDGIITLNNDLVVKKINPAGQSMLGYSQEEALGKPVNNILVSGHPLLNHIVQVQTDKENREVGDVKIHRRDGSDLFANVRIQWLQIEDISEIIIFVTDLSENEALHVQSQQLQQRAWLGEVTAIFAHEVRNPINNISTGLQLMQLNFEKDDPLQEQITALQEDCDRLEHRMKSVLSFSRSMKHNPAPIDLGKFCEDQVMRWKPKMARNGTEAQLTIEAQNPLIMGDQQALDQVFTNLINNSIQALSAMENGIIAIKIRASQSDAGDPTIGLHFSDNGPGIPEDLAKRVFDPFFTTKESEGTGLGLAITKRIIQAHKGTIELESFPGGTFFKINLPAIQAFKESK